MNQAGNFAEYQYTGEVDGPEIIFALATLLSLPG